VREPGHDPPERDPEPETPPQVEPVTPPPAGDPPDERPPVREPSPVEEPETLGQRLTHPGKVLFPEMGLTKLDLARYWIAVADEAIPALAGRPLMLLRCPEGRGRTCFFQKHPTGPLPAGLSAVRVREKKGTDSYAVVKDRRGLVALVQQGVLEIHVWGSRADRLEQPDRMVFDIDPDPQTPWPRVVGAARGVRARLESLGLDSFLKTTGGKGLHVVVPLRRGPGWEDVRAFSAAVASGLVREDPALWTTQLSKAKRGGRIFLDTLRNGRGATWVAAYSPRAREGAPVSMPIAWSELGEGLDPGRFTVASVPTLLRQRAKDPWAGIGTTRQTLRASLLRQVMGRSSRAER
jgi:bifunctional non-homologous end joining protein LigD